MPGRGEGQVCVGLRYNLGLSNVVDPDKRWENMNFIMANQYVDSDFTFNPLYISAGYQFTWGQMYSVRKQK